MHGQRNFPLVKEGSDLDIELPDGTILASAASWRFAVSNHSLTLGLPTFEIGRQVIICCFCVVANLDQS